MALPVNGSPEITEFSTNFNLLDGAVSMKSGRRAIGRNGEAASEVVP